MATPKQQIQFILPINVCYYACLLLLVISMLLRILFAVFSLNVGSHPNVLLQKMMLCRQSAILG